MQEKHLYNIETDTLLSFAPESRCINIKSSFNQSFKMDIVDFAFVYSLGMSHPHPVHYADFYKIYDNIDSTLQNQKGIDTLAASLKKDLKGYGVTDFIVKVKRKGYIVSNKWVTPDEAEKIKSKNRFMKFFKHLVPALNNITL